MFEVSIETVTLCSHVIQSKKSDEILQKRVTVVISVLHNIKVKCDLL